MFDEPSTWRNATIVGRPWQDWLFSVAGVVFIVGLVPMLLSGADVPMFTGLSTATMLYCFAAAHVSYRNWMSVCTEMTTATIWLLLGLGVSL